MTTRIPGLILLLLCVTFGCAPSMASHGKTLKPFANDAEFSQWLAKRKVQPALRETPPEESVVQTVAVAGATPPPPPPASAPMGMAASAKAANLDSIAVTGAHTSGDAKKQSITNVQTQGVDEGDIVKQHGNFLIVLRRGRLFTIRIGADSLQPVSTVNAYAPDADPSNTWYDEMLIADGRIVVIGYSYERGGTEIGLFDLDDRGAITYRATYQMRSSDYYSSRNYASRLIGHQLIFYSPLQVNAYDHDPSMFLPAVRRWHRGTTPADFHRILPANRIYRSDSDFSSDEGTSLHSVSICDIDAPTMQCHSTAVLGPPGRVFYVSADSVYIWTSSWINKAAHSSAVFRIPLDGRAPTGLLTSGSPIDQMSFLQRDSYLNVVLGRESNGESMWSADGTTPGQIALLRVRLADFGDGTTAAPSTDYRVLPGFERNQSSVQNRFIGDWLVYGAGTLWYPPPTGSAGEYTAHAFRFATSAPVQALLLDHPVERIDAMGSDAILVGSKDANLHFTSVSLQRDAVVVNAYVQPNAAQGDQRTHGFFYQPQSESQGIVGLPIVRSDGGSAAVLYLHNVALRLSKMGRLDSRATTNIDDGCRASCVDWYGNARPIFIGDRIFALLGYELVEGHLNSGRITERRRASFAPAAPVAR